MSIKASQSVIDIVTTPMSQPEALFDYGGEYTRTFFLCK